MNARLNAPCAEPCSSTGGALPGPRDNNNATEARSTSDKWPGSRTNWSVPLLGWLGPHLLRAATPDHLIHLEWFRHRNILPLYDIGLSPAHYMLHRSHTKRAGGQACGAASRRPVLASQPCPLESAHAWRSVCFTLASESRGKRCRPHAIWPRQTACERASTCLKQPVEAFVGVCA